jgi:hypothetical protein
MQTEPKLLVEPELGKRIELPREIDRGFCMSSPGQMDICVKATLNRMKYVVGYRQRGSLVTYVHTEDLNFRSPEGLRVGDVLKIENSDSIIAAPGWEIYGRRGKGWVPVIGFNGKVSVIRDNEENETLEVTALRPTTINPIRVRIIGFTKR